MLEDYHRRSRTVTAMLSTLASILALAASPWPDDEVWTLGNITVETSPIYSTERASRSVLARLVNASHWTTRESVVRREIWREPGDDIDEQFARELERNLRATGLFASVEARLVPGAEPGVRDLVVTTRDRLSISGGASGSFVGNVASGGFSLSESNVFGTGDRLRFGFFENDFGEFRGSLSYRDRYLLGSWTSATAEVGRTEAGDFVAARVDRPFRYLADSFSYDLSARDADIERDYFLDGESVAEVPFEEIRAAASATWRRGTRFRNWTFGPRARFTETLYGRARGDVTVRVPGDTTAAFVGVAAGFTDIDRFEKVTGLDTLHFVQDVRIGGSYSLEVGATHRDESGASELIEPTAAASARYATAIAGSRFLSVDFGGSARTYAGDPRGWRADVRLRAFDTSMAPHTLAAGWSFTEVREDEDLPVQLTLGGGSGLRGYPSREFVGQRTAVLNLEDRIDLDLRLGSIDVGAVVFADIGWAAARGEGFGRPMRSVGAGLRFGSNPLLGRGILRLDVAVPLDEPDGSSYDPLVSLTLGQVFEF